MGEQHGITRRRALRGALAVGVAAALIGSASSTASAAVLTYAETAEYVSDEDVRMGRATATAGDTVAFTRTLGESVEVVTVDEAGEPVAQQRLIPPTTGGSFGIDLALNDDATMLYVAQSRFSQIQVYGRGADSWSHHRTLTALEAPPERVASYGANIASAIDVSGDRLVAGVPNARVDGQTSAGFAFAINLTTDTWEPLIPEVTLPNSITGEEVAVSGDLVAVGAQQARDVDRGRVGGVYLWDLSTDSAPLFTHQPDTDPRVCLPTSGGGVGFGNSLAFAGDDLVVGSPAESNYSGDDPDDAATGCTTEAVDAGNTTDRAVYLFDAKLQQIGPKIVPPLHHTDFAMSIGASEDTLVVGGSQDSVGSAHVYDLSAIDRESTGDENGRQRPAPVQSLTPANPPQNFAQNAHGSGLAVAPSQIVVGTLNSAVHIFGAEAQPVVLATSDVGAVYGEAATLTASVESGDAPDGATVRFTVDGAPVGEPELADGAAALTLDLDAYDAGTYETSAQLLAGDGDGDGGVVGDAATGALTIAQASTVTELTLTESDPTVPNITGTVVGEHGTTPTGAVEITDDGELLDTVELDDAGAFTWEAPTSPADRSGSILRRRQSRAI